jgi:hypothetical protein
LLHDLLLVIRKNELAEAHRLVVEFVLVAQQADGLCKYERPLHHFRHRVPSCRAGPDERLRFDPKLGAGGLESSAEGRRVEDFGCEPSNLGQPVSGLV